MNKILIHTCCTDCVLKTIDALTREFLYSLSTIDLYYFNPNIHPETEWLARLKALKTMTKEKNIRLIIPNWQPKKYFERIQQLRVNNIDHNNSSLRCPQCYALRLEETAQYAAQKEYTAFTSTMLSSSYMNTQTIQILGRQLAKKHQVEFIEPHSFNTCLHTSGFYKQNYCGCIYSLNGRIEEKYFANS